VLVVGGAARTPGAAQLTGLAALRVGAGHLTLAVADSVAVALAVATPEAGIIGLAQTAEGSVRGDDLSAISDPLGESDVVVIGPGLDDPDHTEKLLREAIPALGPETWLILDAYALGVLPKLSDVAGAVGGRLILTPNSEEASRLLGRDLDRTETDVPEIAARYQAVVTSKGIIADPGGGVWRIGSGHGGLATSGSGDVLAGAVAGLLARGADPSQAACWASHVHAAAGDRLAVSVGAMGFLARELLDELPRVLVELGA
jgi:ADP-dependent NAD(P)H-hydrate dehydratase